MPRGRLRPSIVTWQDYISGDSWPIFPDLHLLAEGDSWFNISGLPAYNLLFELRFRKHTRIVNCGMPGDTIKNMAQVAKNRHLRDALAPGGFRWTPSCSAAGATT